MYLLLKLSQIAGMERNRKGEGGTEENEVEGEKIDQEANIY